MGRRNHGGGADNPITIHVADPLIMVLFEIKKEACQSRIAQRGWVGGEEEHLPEA